MLQAQSPRRSACETLLGTYVGQRVSSLATLIAIACSACARQWAAPAPPHPVSPSVQAQPPDDGHGRLIIDVSDGAVAVERIHMRPTAFQDESGRTRFSFQQEVVLVCEQSPCVLDTQPGNVLLRFPVLGNTNDSESELVHVSANETVYRRTLSYRRRAGAARVLGIVGTTFGGMGAIAGATLLPVGLATDKRGMATAGAITLGASSVLLGLSIWALYADRPGYRPGSSIHFDASK